MSARTSETDHGAAAYVLGALTSTDRREFEEHLATCRSCQQQVRQFAGLPALLALAEEADFTDPAPLPEPPAELLPRLLAVAAARRRHRRWWYGAGIAAALVAVALGAVLMFRPGTTDRPAAGTEVAMTPLAGGPATVSLRLTDRDWGTDITVTCSYPEYPSGGPGDEIPYTLAVIDRSGAVSDAGSWSATAGTKTMSAATALHPDQIAALEVRLPDGTPIMRAVR